jgi:hypothetical protein
MVRIAPANRVDSPWLEEIPPRKRFLFQQNLEMGWPINAGAAQPRWGVQRVTKLEVVVNMKTAKSLGLEIPVPLLGRADEAIE